MRLLKLKDKNEICSKFNILSGFASYGAGMHYPIYILNIPRAISGADIVFKKDLVDKWTWIHCKYCHKKRIYEETLLPSFSNNEEGYEVDLKYLEDYLIKQFLNI